MVVYEVRGNLEENPHFSAQVLNNPIKNNKPNNKYDIKRIRIVSLTYMS